MDNEKTDLEIRLQKAKITYARYKQLVQTHPEEQERLHPILQGCRDLIWDLEQRLQATPRAS